MTEEAAAELESASTDDNAAPSPVSEAEAKPASEAEASAAATQEEPKKPANPVQPRINQLIRDRREKELENEELRAENAQLKQAKPAVPIAVPVAPKEDDFETDSDYQAANAQFIADAAAKAAMDAVAAENQTRVETETQDKRKAELEGKKKSFEDKLEPIRGNFDDFDKVAYDHPFMDLDLVEQIFDLDKGPEVAYHLGSNLEEAERIFSLSPVQRARELTKIEFQVEALKPKVVSDAPDPITPLGNSESVEQDPEKMTADEWQQWDFERQRKKRGA